MTRSRGAQSERTGLAWHRTALGSVGCTLLLLRSAAMHGWGFEIIPVCLAGVTSVMLALIGQWRERSLDATAPAAADAALPALASVFVTATAVSALLLR